MLYFVISFQWWEKSVTQKVNFTIFKICVWKFWIQNWCSMLWLIVSCLWNFAWQLSGSMKSKPKWEDLHVNSRSWTSVYCVWTSCSLHEYWFIFYLVGATKNNSNRLQCFVSPLDNSKQQLKSELPLSGLWDFVKWSLSLRWSNISLDRKIWSTLYTDIDVSYFGYLDNIMTLVTFPGILIVI